MAKAQDKKNIYRQAREEAGLTRERAADRMDTVSARRLEHLEYGSTPATPADVMEMAKAYGRPDLCNYYCSHNCPIGREMTPPIERDRELSDIVLRTLASLNRMDAQKPTLIDISADGKISDDELTDFARIQNQLEDITVAAESLRLWTQKAIASGSIDEEKLRRIRKELREKERR